MGVAGDLHLVQLLLVGESLHHVIALNLGVVQAVFLYGHKRVGEGFEAADFLLLHLHFHGIAAETGERIPHHGVAVEVEGRIAAVKREFLAGARGGLLAEGHVVDGLQGDGFGGVAVVMKGIAFDPKQVIATALVGHCAVPHREGFGVAAVMGMLAPHLPLVQRIVDIDFAVGDAALVFFVEKEGVAQHRSARIEERYLSIKLAFLGFGEVVTAVENHGAGFVIELCDGEKLRFFEVGAILQRIGFHGIFGGGEHHFVFEEEGFEGGVVAARDRGELGFFVFDVAAVAVPAHFGLGVVLDPGGGEGHAAIGEGNAAGDFGDVGGVVVFEGFAGDCGAVGVGDAHVAAAYEVFGLGVVLGLIAEDGGAGLFKSHIFSEPLHGFVALFERFHPSGLQRDGLGMQLR